MELSPYFGCKYEAPALAVETWIAFSELPDYARRKYEAPALAVETPLRWSAAGATRVASTKPLRWPLKRLEHRAALPPAAGRKYEAPALAVETQTWSSITQRSIVASTKPLRWPLKPQREAIEREARDVASTKPLRWPLKRRCDTAMFRKSILPELREHGTDILDATVKRPSATLRELMPFRPTLGVRAQPRLNAP